MTDYSYMGPGEWSKWIREAVAESIGVDVGLVGAALAHPGLVIITVPSGITQASLDAANEAAAKHMPLLMDWRINT